MSTLQIQFTLGPGGVITEIHADIGLLLGHPREKCVGRSLYDFVHPAHRFMIDSFLLPSPTGAHPLQTAAAFIDSEGVTVYILLHRKTVVEKDGELHVIHGTLRDITIPRHREKAARQAPDGLENSVRQAAVRDALTGLYNRPYFEQQIAHMDAARHHPIGILICDVDGLQAVNNTRGLRAGNQLLVDAAGLVRGSFRATDIIARTAGSRFTVILPEAGARRLKTIRRRLNKAVACYNRTNPGTPLSLAVGTAVGRPGESPLDTYQRAKNVLSRKKLHRPKSRQHAVVRVLLTALAERDFITEEHTRRMGHVVALLGAAVGLSEEETADLKLLAYFHDIGKLAVPDSILLKPGPLSPKERLKMNRHPEVGYRIALSSPELAPIAEMILTHHEWWNGKGYPRQISGTDIPLECRILAVVDAYDAMTNDRPYRKAMSHREALQELVRCSGTQFDPRVVRSFIKLTKDNKDICADGP